MNEREEFEAWFNGWCDPHIGHVEVGIERSATWAAWQAARASQPAGQAPVVPDDVLAVNLMRLAGPGKHKARECEQIVKQVLAAQPPSHPQAPLHDPVLTKLEELQKRAEERRQKYRLWQGPCEGLTDAEARTAWLTAMGFDDGTQPVNEHDLRYLTRVIEQALAAKWGVVLKEEGK